MLSDTAPTAAKTSRLPFWLLFLAFLFAELVTALLQPLAGLFCHGIVLCCLLVSSAFLKDEKTRNLVISLSLVPLIRIISLSMPLARLPQIYWYILIYIPLLAAAIVVMRIAGLKFTQIGFVARQLPWQIICGVIFGLAVGIVEYAILRPQPLVQEFSLGAIWLPAVIMFFTTGMVEEIIFRGVLQQTAESAMGRMGLLYVSAIFAILHIGHLSVLDVLFVFALGIFLAYVVKRTGSLIGVICAHGITNVFMYLIVAFLLP